MEAPAEPIAEPTTAHNMVALLLKLANNDPVRHERVLREALQRMETSQRVLQEQRLRYVERGDERFWQTQYDLKTALVAEITRVLAERFGQ